MLADYHVHSEFSDDSVFPVNDVCALAIERGIDEICFTDHVDFEIRPDWDEYRADPSCAPIIEGQPSINVDYERYFPTIAVARLAGNARASYFARRESRNISAEADAPPPST